MALASEEYTNHTRTLVESAIRSGAIVIIITSLAEMGCKLESKKWHLVIRLTLTLTTFTFKNKVSLPYTDHPGYGSWHCCSCISRDFSI